MNSKGQGVIGTALLLVFFLLSLTLFGLIPVFIEVLDDVRDNSSLNCQGTSTFNATAFQEDSDNASSLSRLTRRPTCVITGFAMVWFVLAFLIAATVWLANNWTRKKRRIVR